MKRNDTAVPLWRQLQATAVVIDFVRSGGSGTAAVEAVSVDLQDMVCGEAPGAAPDQVQQQCRP